MKQSEKLLKLKDAGTILISLGILIMCITPVIMVAREVYDFHAWLTVWRWGVGVAFTGLAIRIARFLYLWQYSLGSPSGLPFIQDTEQWLSTAYRLYKHQLQKQVKPQQTPIAQQTNRVRYAVYGTQYPVSTIRYMVLSPAAHRGKSSATAKKWREKKKDQSGCVIVYNHTLNLALCKQIIFSLSD